MKIQIQTHGCIGPFQVPTLALALAGRGPSLVPTLALAIAELTR